jgi:hypothetical protein
MSMSQRKPLAALAAGTAALALALPVASAGAATTASPVSTASLSLGLVPGSIPCQLLVSQLSFAAQFGNPLWANFLSNLFIYSGCGGAAI